MIQVIAKMLLLLLMVTALATSVLAQDCDPVDFGQGSVICKCNATYCDFYPDPTPPSTGKFLHYVSSKAGERLSHSDGIISNAPEYKSTVTINANKQYQTVEGFGGALTDAAGINIKSLDEKAQNNLLRSYFSSEGSNYNFIRVPIGGSDFSTRAYTYDDVPGDRTLSSFALADEDTQLKIPFLKKALELNPSVRLVSAAWTAPPWMKNLNKYNGYTHLLEENYQIYADYIIKFLEEYKKNGLELWAVSTGNEPFTSILPFSSINSMFWSARTASKWVTENLGPTLEKSVSNNTLLLMLDDQRIALPWYMIDVKNNYPEALKYVKGIAVHWYTDAVVPAIVLDKTHDLVPDKFILMTEACVGDRPWEYPKVQLGSWSRAEKLIIKIFENLNHWVVGWIDWNLALDTKGGPNWVDNYVDAPIIVIPQNNEFYKQPMFYALSHFSKFVPRNSSRISTVSSDSNVLSTAFKTKDNQIVVLLYNESGRPKNITLIDEQVGNININLPEKSIHTILYKNT